MIFAGRDLSQKITYLKNQGRELNLSINYPSIHESIVKIYISLFGKP